MGVGRGPGDLIESGGYFGGRGGPIAQANFIRYGVLRLFAIGGFAWGVDSGPMFGAGVELRSRSRIGFRATVQDYPMQEEGVDCHAHGLSQSYCDAIPHGGRPYTAHRPSVQFGISWR